MNDVFKLPGEKGREMQYNKLIIIKKHNSKLVSVSQNSITTALRKSGIGTKHMNT